MPFKGALRVAKNYTKGYSDTQAKVRDATSNDPCGPWQTQMYQLARLSYNRNDCVEIMEMLDKRLNDKGKNWRHVSKSLSVLDYLLHVGSVNVVLYFRSNLYIIKTLKEFQYVDEDNKDCGANVRHKAVHISSLLSDTGRLREERRIQGSMGGWRVEELPDSDDEDDMKRSRAPESRRSGDGDEDEDEDEDDDELKRAIEASRQTHAEERVRQAEEKDLERAIRLSEEEEARRNKAVEDSNAAALFNDQAQLPSSASPPIVNLTTYATGLQPRFTIHPQYTMQPRFTSFNPYQQQMQLEVMQAEYMGQQQALQAQQQAQALQQQQDAWFRQQALQVQQQQLAEPASGSNNPFAPALLMSPMSHTSSPQIDGIGASGGPSFNLQSAYGNLAPPPYGSTPSPTPIAFSGQSKPEASPFATLNTMGKESTRADQEHSRLANLFANREAGQDTFGNVGVLRYGQTEAGRVVAQETGTGTNNPFTLRQQMQESEQPFFSL